MSGRARRTIASIAAVAFMIFWIWAALAVAEWLPDNAIVQVIYFAVVGVAWGVPLFPLIAWANKGTDPGGGDRP